MIDEEVNIHGDISRVLPQGGIDGTASGPIRMGRYDEAYSLSPIRKQHLLIEEGSYYIVNNAQTGIATPAAATWAATTPVAVIANTDSPTNPFGVGLYLDYAALITTAAGSWASAGVNSQLMIYLDTGDRYTSGGTDLTALITSPNTDTPKKSVAKVRFGNITAAAATGAVRPIVGLRILRPAVSATVTDVVGETKFLNFGGVEGSLNGSITVANANVIPVPLPALRIGPGSCCLIYYVMNGTTPAAASFAPEIGWWER